jgi:thioredoxin reductase
MQKSSDVIIVGGGPAGLSCALILGRCKRKVMLFDTGSYRNESSNSMHGFISREGISPKKFLKLSADDVGKYGVSFFNSAIQKAVKSPDGFTVWDDKGNEYHSKKLVLASGLNDELPPLKDIEIFYGKSVFHCPYCDGWEFRDKPWAVYAKKKKTAIELALRYKSWTNDITLFTHHLKDFRKSEVAELKKCGVKLMHEEIKVLKGKDGLLDTIITTKGTRIKIAALFFSTGSRQKSDLAFQLQCKTSRKGLIRFDKLQQTNIQGLHVAGDMARDMQFVIVAAAEGAKAGVAINEELNLESRSVKI